MGSSSTASSKSWNSSVLFLWPLCETYKKPVFKAYSTAVFAGASIILPKDTNRMLQLDIITDKLHLPVVPREHV